MATTRERIGYVVAITEIFRDTSTETKNFVVDKQPTEITEEEYSGGRKKVAYSEKYEVRDVEKIETKTREIYRQEIEASQLDLVSIVNAVNAKK